MHVRVYDEDGELVGEYTLSRNEWLAATGQVRAKQQRETWNAAMQAVNDELSGTSPKTADIDKFGAYVATVATHNDALWRHALHPRVAQQELRTYILKQRKMDRWLNGVKEKASAGGYEVRVAYGDANFSPTGRGEAAPAPTAFQYKRVLLAFGASAVTLVDEYCTTKCCAACGKRGVTTVLQDVYDPRQHVDGKRPHAVRGLKRCPNTGCTSFYNRDGNAAANIHAAYVAMARGAARPAHLARDNDASRGPRPRFTLGPKQQSKQDTLSEGQAAEMVL